MSLRSFCILLICIVPFITTNFANAQREAEPKVEPKDKPQPTKISAHDAAQAVKDDNPPMTGRFGIDHISDAAVTVASDELALELDKEKRLKTGGELLSSLRPDALDDVYWPEISQRPSNLSAIYEYRSRSVLRVRRASRHNDHFHTGTVATAFVISADGFCVTNHHVFEGKDTLLFVVDRDNRAFAIEFIARVDEANDLAIFKIDVEKIEGEPLPPLSLRPNAAVGTKVALIAHPRGLDYYLTDGIISRRVRNMVKGPPISFVNRITITAEFGVGSSGGPVMDMKGNVLGVVSSTSPVHYQSGDRKVFQMSIRTCIPAEEIINLIKSKKDDAKPQ